MKFNKLRNLKLSREVLYYMCTVSVIIPVYNVEKYIRQCLDSVIDQTFTNFEVILVDDGSTDRSGDICDEYSKRDTRFKAIHKMNGGSSSARNIGIDASLGECIYFLDSDDWIEKETLEVLLLNMGKNSRSIVICGYAISDGSSVISKTKQEFFTNDSKQIINRFIRKEYSYSVWNKLYCRKLIKENRIYFPTRIKYGEDQSFNLIYLSYCDNSIVISQSLYNYRIRKGSITNNFSIDSLEHYKASEDLIIKAFKENNKYEEYKELIAAHYIYVFNDFFGSIFRINNLSITKKYLIFKDIFIDFNKKGFHKIKFIKYLIEKKKIIGIIFKLGLPSLLMLFYQIHYYIIQIKRKLGVYLQ